VANAVQVIWHSFSQSLRILRQYIAENRKVPHTQRPIPKLIFDWGNTWFFVLLVSCLS